MALTTDARSRLLWASRFESSNRVHNLPCPARMLWRICERHSVGKLACVTQGSTDGCCLQAVSTYTGDLAAAWHERQVQRMLYTSIACTLLWNPTSRPAAFVPPAATAVAQHACAVQPNAVVGGRRSASSASACVPCVNGNLPLRCDHCYRQVCRRLLSYCHCRSRGTCRALCRRRQQREAVASDIHPRRDMA